MTWRKKQPQRWKPLAQTKENSGEHFLFTTMRAATKKHETFRIFDWRIPQGCGRVCRYAFCLNIRIKFNTAGHVDSVPRNTQRCPTFDVALFRYTYAIEKPERWRDKKTKPQVTTPRTRRKSGVDERQRDQAPM